MPRAACQHRPSSSLTRAISENTEPTTQPRNGIHWFCMQSPNSKEKRDLLNEKRKEGKGAKSGALTDRRLKHAGATGQMESEIRRTEAQCGEDIPDIGVAIVEEIERARGNNNEERERGGRKRER
ncbi:uncharacterized protein J3R85_020932 [Psidium guajava]|nr:uncharacterized protein J3R85_020932 [Psidium guajava]